MPRHARLQQLDRLRADNDLVLYQLTFKPLAQRMPIGSVELGRHDLDHGDAVPFLLAATLPETFARRADKARDAAEPVRQLVEEMVEPLPAYGLTSAGFIREKDLHEMGRPTAHDAWRAGALPGQLSRSVSVVTVSTCSPKRFR